MSSTAFDSFDRRRAPWPRLAAWLEGGRGAQDAIKRSTTFPAKVAPSGVVGARFAAGAGGAGSDDQGRRRIPFPGRGRRPQGVRAGPPEARVLERLMADPDGTSVEGATRDVTVLFADVRGFTGLAESMRDDPQRLAAVMRVILAPLTRIVLAHGGTIDKYMGDCVMAFWGAPFPDRDHPQRAYQAAVAMIAAMPEVNARLRAALGGAGLPTVEIGIGLNSGDCFVGNLGSFQRSDYSVLGDPVNIASRLQRLSKAYDVPVLVGEATARRLPGSTEIYEIDRIAVRGRSEAQGVYACV